MNNQETKLDSIINLVNLLIGEGNNNSIGFDYSKFVPLGAAFLGALIAIFGQWFFKYLDRKNEKKREIKFIISQCYKLQTQIKYQIRDLSYFKQNTEFQLVSHRLENDINTKAKYYDEHYKSNLNIWEVEKSIYLTLSEFVSNIKNYILLLNKKNFFDVELNKLQNIEFEIAKDYTKLTILPELNEVNNDILDLKMKILELFKPMDIILKGME
jgi:hypothetical protein